VSDKGHSETGASGADRWFFCPGSVTLSRKVPDGPSGKAAEKGTGAHEVLELCFPDGNCEPSDFIEEEMSNGYVFKEGDVEAVDDAIECLKERSRSIQAAHEIKSEVSFDLTCLHDGLWGTSDVVMAADDMSVLLVDDYKNGVRYVGAENNLQLLFYALGAIWKFCQDHNKEYLIEMNGWGGVFDRVNVGIVQPNCSVEGEIHRTWEVPPEVLDQFAVTLVEKTKAAYNPESPRIPGDQCTWCKAKPICKEFHGNAQKLAKIDFAPTTDPKTITLPDPNHMSLEDVLKLKDFEGMFKSYFESIDDFLLAKLRHGDEVEGYKLVRRNKNRAWLDKDNLEEDLEILMDDPEKLYKKKLITPAQAEKILGKDVIAEFCHKPEGDLMIAPSSDKRAAVAISAKADFSSND